MKFLIFVFSFILAGVSVFSCGTNSSVKTPKGEDTLEIIGWTQLYGNEPHMNLGIVSEDGNEYAIYPYSLGDELKGKLLGHLVKFTVIFLDIPIDYGFYLKGGYVTPLSWEILQ